MNTLKEYSWNVTLVVLLLFGLLATVPSKAAAFDDHDTTRGEIARFDQFLDRHPETARELFRHPKLVRNPEWMGWHPELRRFLWEHPGIREELMEDPKAFMRHERNFERHEWHDDNGRWRDRDGWRRDLDDWDRD